MTDASTAPANPFLAPWTTPFELPPFERIAPEHYRPAFDRALEAHIGEIEAIAGDAAAPTFANTIEALERSGRELRRVAAVFFNLAGSDTNDAMQAIEREIAPRLRRHRSAIYMNAALFRRVAALFDRRDELGLDAEEARVLDRYHTHFVRAGAQLEPEAKARLADDHRAARDARHAVLPERARRREGLHARARRRGRSRRAAGLRARGGGARRRGARPCGQARHHAVALLHRAVPAILGAPRPARAGVPRLDRPRRQRRRHRQQGHHRRDRGACAPSGRSSWATRPSPPSSSPTPWRRRRRRVLGLLRNVWTPALARAGRERDDLQELAREEGGNFALAPWDWRYYAEKVRRARARPRRGRDQALPPARPHHRGGLRHRAPPVRARLRGAPGRAALSPGRARLGGDARRTRMSACSSAIISPAPRSAAAPG